MRRVRRVAHWIAQAIAFGRVSRVLSHPQVGIPVASPWHGGRHDLEEVEMTRWSTAFVAALLLVGANVAAAQEGASGPACSSYGHRVYGSIIINVVP